MVNCTQGLEKTTLATAGPEGPAGPEEAGLHQSVRLMHITCKGASSSAAVRVSSSSSLLAVSVSAARGCSGSIMSPGWLLLIFSLFLFLLRLICFWASDSDRTLHHRLWSSHLILHLIYFSMSGSGLGPNVCQNTATLDDGALCGKLLLLHICLHTVGPCHLPA